MDKIFENAFLVDRRKTDLVPLITEELSVFPAKLLKFCFDNIGQMYVPVPNDKLFFVRNGLYTDIYDKRNPMETSHVYLFRNGTIEFVLAYHEMDFLKNNYPHSPAIHEFFHLIDFIFGRLNGKKGYHFLHEELPKGKPLDWYANINLAEKFAVSGEAFCHSELFVSKDYRTHNKLELYQKSPEIYGYFENFFAQWK